MAIDTYVGEVDDTSTLGPARIAVEVFTDMCITCTGTAIITTPTGDRVCPNCADGRVSTVEITVSRVDDQGTQTERCLVLSMAETREVCHGLVSGLR